MTGDPAFEHLAVLAARQAEARGEDTDGVARAVLHALEPVLRGDTAGLRARVDMLDETVSRVARVLDRILGAVEHDRLTSPPPPP